MKKILVLMILMSFQGWTQKQDESWQEVETKGIPSYEIKRFVIANGGGTVQSGDYKLSGTIGQSVAHNQVVSGVYKLRGGFWVHSGNDVIFKNSFE